MNIDKTARALSWVIGITSVIGTGTIVNWIMKFIFYLSTGVFI